MKVYKVVNSNQTTINGYKWELGVKQIHERELVPCQSGFHAYQDPLLATLLHLAHVSFNTPVLYLAKAGGEAIHQADKSVFTEMTLIKLMDFPKITTEQRVEFAIRVALLVCKETSFMRWANGWLSGKDRSAAEAAYAAYAAAAAKAAYAAYDAAAYAAAAYAAKAAAAAAAEAAANAAYTAAYAAAYAAANAAAYAAKAAIAYEDLLKIAQQVCRER